MAKVTIREARYFELPRISQVLAQAFWDDNLNGDLIHPHRNKFPADVELYWLRRCRVNYWDYTWRWLVAVSRDEKTGTEAIVGIAEWARLGEGRKKLQCSWYDPRNALKPLSSIAMRVHAWIRPNRACDPHQEDVIERTYPFLDGRVWTGDRSESWYLEFLAVHPDAQGKGVGFKLVQWGLEKAEEEGICASVIAAKGKDPFYRKCGFNVQDGHCGMGEGNPLANVEGGNIFWKMPGKACSTPT